MARHHTCDICKKPARIVRKLLYAPIGSSNHSNYTHHLDIGECCEKRILEVFQWRPRNKRKPPEIKKDEPKKGVKK